MNTVSLPTRKTGFTVVELLIVMVVIGIIATVSIVAYRTADQRASNASAQSTQVQFMKRAETYMSQYENYPVSVTNCPNPTAANICLPLKSGQTLSYFVFSSAVSPRFSAALHGPVPEIEMLFMDSKAFYYSSNAEITHTNEFVQYMDMAPIIDKYGAGKPYKISFDIKSASTANYNTVMVYMQNGSGARYGFSASVPVTTSYQRQSVTVTPSGPNTTFTQSVLAFYGQYNPPGNRPTVRNVVIEPGF